MARPHRTPPPAAKARDEKRPYAILESVPPGRSRAAEMLSSIGITDGKIVARAVELFGESGIAERVAFIESCSIFDDRTRDAAKKIFRLKPEIVLATDIGIFMNGIFILGEKRDIIDSWCRANDRDPPVKLDYQQRPEALLFDAKDIADILGLNLRPKESKARGDARIAAMRSDDFIRALETLGFVKMKRGATSHQQMKHPDGRTTTVKMDTEFPEWLVKTKVAEAKIAEDEFIEAMRKAKLIK